MRNEENGVDSRGVKGDMIARQIFLRGQITVPRGAVQKRSIFLPRSLFQVWPGIIAHLKAAEHRALLLDFDGTLRQPFGEHPVDVRLSTRTRDALARLLRHRDLYVAAIVSGRRVGILTPGFREGAHYFSLYGFFLPRGSPCDSARTQSLLFVLAKRDARSLLAHCPGVWIEDKGLDFAVHYRGRDQK